MKALFGFIFLLCFRPAFSQVTVDATQAAERWPVKKHRGVFGLAKPDFGPYHTLAVYKLDSAAMRKKTKEGTAVQGSVSSSGLGLDMTKRQTIEKRVYYELQLATGSDTTEATFLIASTSREEKQTMVGKLFSKSDDNTSPILSYTRDVSGAIQVGSSDAPWRFFIDNYSSGPYASFGTAWLKKGDDSIFVKRRAAGATGFYSAGDDEPLALLQQNDTKLYVSFANDNNLFRQRAVAALLAVLVSIKEMGLH